MEYKINVNPEVVSDLLSKLMQAAESGSGIDFSDGDEVGQYVFSLFALAAELVPVIGSALGAFASLLGSIFFSPNSMDKIWEGLRERIEQLIDSKIESYHLEVLRLKVKGLQSNMEIYQQYQNAYATATGTDREKAGNDLKTHHAAFLAVVVAALPEFQHEQFTVASLPLFAVVANIHLTLLADAIKKGADWGYASGIIASLKKLFESKTSGKGTKMPGEQDLSWQKHALEEAIEAGPAMGIPADVIATWKEAYVDLFGPTKKPRDREDINLDYISYAKKIYNQGRAEVKSYRADVGDKGGPDAAKYRAYSDYDSCMIMHVLSYAEFWPYITGDPIPESALRAIDREIFCGPYGRYVKWASWDPSNPPPITDRGSNLTSVIIRAWDDVDGMKIKYGPNWGSWQGSGSGGAPKQIDLADDEWFSSVEATYGHKLGRVKLGTNKGRSLENGVARHATITKGAAPPGYELTSISITNWESHIPPGCEGIIFGFRPLITNSSRAYLQQALRRLKLNGSTTEDNSS
jgi:hypothetical protein